MALPAVAPYVQGPLEQLLPQRISNGLRCRCRPHTGCRPAAAVVEPGQLAAIAAEPVAEVALLSAAGALSAKQGLLPLQGR